MGLIQTFWNRVTGANQGKIFIVGRNHVGGVWLTHDEVLKIAAVWACTNVISKAIASSEWEVFLEDLSNGDRKALPASRAYYLFNIRPNEETTPMAFKETMVGNALLWGDAFAEIERDTMNRPVAVWQLEPHRCELIRGFWDGHGRFTMDLNGDLALRVLNFGAAASYLRYENVYHVHGFGVNGTSGIDICGVAAKTFLQSLAADEFALKYYEHGTQLGGVLTTDKDLDQTKLDGLKKSISDRVSGVDNAFQFLVLGNGLKWQTLSQTLGDGQYIETRYFLIEEVCRFFGVPPHKIAHLLRATFGNIEHQGIEFSRDGLKPWAIRCQEEGEYKILPVGLARIRVNLDWASEGDSKTQAEVDSIRVNNGLAKRNEIRRKRGMNSLGPDGDLLTVNGNMTTLENVGKAKPMGGGSPGSQVSEPQAPEPGPPKAQIAKSFFKMALQRCLNRQTHRAQDAKSVAFHNIKDKRGRRVDFARRLDSSEAAQSQFVQRQIEEVISGCLNLGIEFNISDLIAAAKNYCLQEKTMLLASYPGNIPMWCNIEERAQDVAEELAKFAL